MKKKLTNTRVINSIGIGILAMVTAGTPVLAEINDAMNDNSTDDTSVSDIPAEPVEQAAPSQNEQILQTLTDTQGLIQEMVQAPESGQTTMEGSGTPAEIPSAEEPGTPAETVPAEGAAGSENVTPPATEDTTTIGDGSSTGADGSQTSGDGDAGDNGTAEQPPAEGEETQNPPADEGAEDAENGDVTQGADTGTTEGQAPTVKDHLQDTADSLGAIINDINGLEQKNAEAKDAVDKYEDAVDKPVVDLLVDWAADASSDAADAAESAAVDEETARDQAQIAVDAQNRGYASREEAEAARQQAQAAADAAEEAYRSAQAAVEEAENKVANAGTTVEELERLKNEAAAALEEMNAKVADAQERLRTILASYGFDVKDMTPGSFDKNQLEGEAKKAYESAEKALEQATVEQATAQRNYDNAVKELEPAVTDFETMQEQLNVLTGAFGTAKDVADESIKALDQEELKQIITDYNKTAEEAEQIRQALVQAQNALAQAQDAWNEAEKVKENSVNVVNNAKKALEKASEKKEDSIEEAENAAQDALRAVNQDSANAQEVFDRAQKAQVDAAAAAAEVERAAKSLEGVRKKAEEAEIDLNNKKDALIKAGEECKNAENAYREANALLDETEKKVLEKREEIVKKAQGKVTSTSGAATAKHEFVKALLCFKLDLDGIKYTKEPVIEHNPNGSGGYIIKVEENDKITKYNFSYSGDKLKIYKEGTNPFYSEEEFDALSDKKKDAEDKKVAWENAETKFEAAQAAVAAATAELERVNDQVDVVDSLGKVAAALTEVQDKADELVKAKTDYQKEYKKNKDSIAAKLSNLISKGTDLKEANANLANAKEAKTRVDEAIKALTNLSVQEGVDRSEEYERLKNAYGAAMTDYEAALDALGQCISSRNRAQTEKDRAWTAANAVFRYITDNNTGTVTPIQPGTLNPIYGTIIDSITSPIIGNTGVSTPSGTTGTGYGYTGYTYTVGGQPVYAVGETAAPEEEQAEENLVSVEEAAVPLAEVGENNNRRTTNARNTTNTRKVSDEKIPLADVETENNKISWWWILVIALLGATGTELYIRHQKKEEEERKSRTDKQGYAKI